MRNLKRALSLTLASVMLLGMMVIGTSAASFTDADQISNVTAATVLQELEVMQGSNGKFNPNSTVTRGQMAILICKMLYGSKLNAENFAGTSEFTDVPANAYYTGYVNLASQLGIISGYGNGKFGPGAPVTTAQAALMLTRALGWFQAGELENQSWTSNAIAAVEKATAVNLFGDLKLANNDPLSRDNVCEMVFNAMTKTAPVKYNTRWEMYYSDEGSIMSGVRFNYANSLGYKNFDLVYDDADDNIDEFGRPIVEWGISKNPITTDPATGEITSKVTFKTSIIKSSDTADATYTAEVKASEIYKDLGLSKNVKVTPTVDGAADEEITLSRSNDDVKLGGNGILVEAYKKADETIVITVIHTYLAQATEDFDDKDEEVNIDIFNDNADNVDLELEDFAVSNVKEDDYLLVTLTRKDDGSLKEIQTVTAAKSLLDVTVTAARKNDYVTADGTRYKYNGTAKGDDDTGALGYEYIAAGTDYDLNNGTYNLYFDSYGYVLGVEEAEAEANVKDYLIVTQTGTTNGYDAIVKVMFMDGTKKTITVNKITVEGESYKTSDVGKKDQPATIEDYANGIVMGTFCTFKEKSGEYELTFVPTSGKDEVTSPTNALNKAQDGTTPVTTEIQSKVTPLKSESGLRGDSKTLFIADGKTFTGVKNAPETKSGDVYYVLNKDGDLLIVWTDEEGKNSSSDLVYVLDAKAEVSGDNDVYTYKAIINGKEGEIKTSNEKVAVGLYEVASYDSDNIADLEAKPVTDASYDSDHTYEHAEGVKELKSDSAQEFVFVTDSKDAKAAYELADKYQIISVDGTTVNDNVQAKGLESLFKKGFTDVIVVREKDDEDAKAVTIYVIKPAEDKGDDKTEPTATLDTSKLPANIGVGDKLDAAAVVSVKVENGTAKSYDWQFCATDSKTDSDWKTVTATQGTAKDGTFAPATDAKGEFFVRCVVTLDDDTTKVTSGSTKITVKEYATAPTVAFAFSASDTAVSLTDKAGTAATTAGDAVKITVTSGQTIAVEVSKDSKLTGTLVAKPPVSTGTAATIYTSASGDNGVLTVEVTITEADKLDLVQTYKITVTAS